MAELSNEDEQHEPFFKCQPKEIAVLMPRKRNELTPHRITTDLGIYSFNVICLKLLHVLQHELNLDTWEQEETQVEDQNNTPTLAVDNLTLTMGNYVKCNVKDVTCRIRRILAVFI